MTKAKESNKKEKKLKIMVNSNAPYSSSGYGQQVRQFMPLMVAEGYKTACIAFYGLEGGIINLDGVWIYPKMKDQWGADAMVNHGKHFNADVIFTLQDIWTLDPKALKKVAQDKRCWIPIVPIDSEPVAPAIFDRLKLAYRVVTYSPFGHRELKRNGMHSTYIPHSVECKDFTKIDKKKAKKKAGIPEDFFVYGMVAANKDNPPRKSFQQVLDAFAEIHKKNPKTALYLHTFVDQKGGFPIMEYAKNLGIDKVIYRTDPYEMLYHIPANRMNEVYGAMDVFLLPSTNEGFGVPIIEASSCEVPVLATDFTAMRDLVIDGETGYKIKVASKKFHHLQAWVAIPDTQDLYDKMLKLYKMSQDERDVMGKKGREFVLKYFDLPVVWKDHWKGFLEQLEEEIYREREKNKKN